MVRALSDLLLRLFYRRIEVVGIERIPPRGPLILAANHQNALVDGMLLLSTIPRRLLALAKAPLFRHPVVGPFLRVLGAVAVYRHQDAGADPARNQEMFRTTIAALAGGGAVMIFPEGVSQAEPQLMPLRSGAARLLLGAEALHEGRLGIGVLPIGLTFHEPGTFRTGWALVLVGEPLATEDCIALHRTAPEEAVRRLTERLGEALRSLIVEAGDRHTMRLVQVAESVWRAESAGAPRDPAARAAWRQRVARAHRYLSTREPSRIAALRRDVERYAKALDLAGLRGDSLLEPPAVGAATRYALREGLALLLGLPLGLWGVVNHALPYQLTRWAVRLARPDADAEATYKLCGSLLLYPACWAAEGWTAWRLGGGWALAVFVVSLAPTGFFALAWSERLERVARETLSFLRFVADRDLAAVLGARRRAIMHELTSLVRLVPPAVLDGRGEERA